MMSNHDGTAPSWITTNYLENLLQEFLNDDSIQVRDIKISSGSSIGDGYTGQIFRIEVDYTQQNKKESRSIIAKSIPITGLSEELSKQFSVYKVELKMMKTLPLIQEELSVKGETEPFFPFLYKVDLDNEMIFMQDLKPEEYVVADRTISLDLDHALLVMKAIAKMHASSFVFLKKNPSRKEDYMDYLRRTKGGIMEKFLEGLYSYLLRSLPLWPISDKDKEIFRNLETKIQDIFYNNFEKKEASFNAIIHGDFSVRNMMIKYEDGKINSVKLIDFQGCNWNSIALDLHYFLMTSVETEVILKHLDELLKTYYDTFVNISGQVEGFTVDTVKKEFTEKLGYGFVIATVYRPAILSKNVLDVAAFIEGRESQANLEMLTNKKFISDVVNLLPIFKEHGIFK